MNVAVVLSHATRCSSRLENNSIKIAEKTGSAGTIAISCSIFSTLISS